VQKISEKEEAQAHFANNDLEVFKAQVRSETERVLRDEMPGILGLSQMELLLQSLIHQRDVYTKVWEAIQPVIDITESIYTRMHRGRIPSTVQNNQVLNPANQ
jgi:hypothetical protein